MGAIPAVLNPPNAEILNMRFTMIRLPEEYARAIADYENWLGAQSFSAHTQRAYLSRNKKFFEYLIQQEVHPSLDDKDSDTWRDIIDGYRTYLKSDLQSSPNSVNNSLTAIEHMLGFLSIEAPKVNRETWPKLAPRALTAQEQEQFVKAANQCKSSKDRALALLLINTGIKLGECAALNVDDVYVSAHTGKVVVKDGRTIPLNATARRALVQWLIDRSKRFGNSETALFLNPQGQRISTVGIDLIVRKIGHVARLDLSAQVLRDTCLTNLVKNGNDLLLVAQIGGHRTIETTRRYSVSKAFNAEEAMERL